MHRRGRAALRKWSTAAQRHRRRADVAEHARLHSLRFEEPIAGVDRKVVMIRTYGYAVGHIGTNGGTAAGMVGTPPYVADQFRAFQEIGITTFLLQFHPMLEEMERFGASVIPRLDV